MSQKIDLRGDEIGGYQLLIDEAAYRDFSQREFVDYPTPPSGYPCYVKTEILADESGIYHYLYHDQIAQMTTILESLTQVPAAGEKTPSAQLVKEYQTALRNLRPDQCIAAEISSIVAIAVVSQLQLASRHPRNVGSTRTLARRFADALLERFGGPESAIARFMRLGWDRAYDEVSG